MWICINAHHNDFVVWKIIGIRGLYTFINCVTITMLKIILPYVLYIHHGMTNTTTLPPPPFPPPSPPPAPSPVTVITITVDLTRCCLSAIT